MRVASLFSAATRKGICSILAADWLRHSTEGALSGLCNSLETENGWTNLSELWELVKVVKNKAAERVDFETWSEERLLNAATPLRLVVTESTGSPDPSASQIPIAQEILAEINRRRHGTTVLPPLFALIKIGGAGQSIMHATALCSWPHGWTRYFDPNFGEFSFERWQDFRDWLPVYYVVSGYNRLYNRYLYLSLFKSDVNNNLLSNEIPAGAFAVNF